MARTREFDPDTALQAAMQVFWRDGYYASSIEDLVEATGVSRYGLYSVYENKRGLFLAALDHYAAHVVRDMSNCLHEPDASLETIRSFVTSLGSFASQPTGQIGCLLWNTASEVAPHDEDAARRVFEFRSWLAKGFLAALRNAVLKGELASDFDTEREADFLSGVVQTIAVLARSRADKTVVSNFVDVSLSTLN